MNYKKVSRRSFDLKHADQGQRKKGAKERQFFLLLVFTVLLIYFRITYFMSPKNKKYCIFWTTLTLIFYCSSITLKSPYSCSLKVSTKVKSRWNHPFAVHLTQLTHQPHAFYLFFFFLKLPVGYLYSVNFSLVQFFFIFFSATDRWWVKKLRTKFLD